MAELNEQFQQYFQIEHAIEVNLEAISEDQLPSNDSDIEQVIPPLFKLVNEVNVLEQTALRPLRQLGDIAEELAHYLKLQSRKIDLVLSHILANENQQEEQLKTVSFGGSGFVLNSDELYPEQQFYRCKLFLKDESAAVFCFCQVLDSKLSVSKLTGNISNENQPGDNQPTVNTYKTRFVFSHIRDQDQELLVRASLHTQAKLLKINQSNKNTD